MSRLRLEKNQRTTQLERKKTFEPRKTEKTNIIAAYKSWLK